MSLRPLILLCLSAFALAQAPSNPKYAYMDSNSLPNVGVILSWGAVSGASYYSVYGKEETWAKDCSTETDWTGGSKGLLDVDLPPTQLSYGHYPQGDQYGWGGYWCYGVSSTIGTIESAIVPVLAPNAKAVSMGMKWYVVWAYMDPTCTSLISQPATNGTLVLTRTRSGNTVTLPGSSAPPPSTWRWAGFARALSYDSFTAYLTLPDGKSFTFPHAFIDSTDGVSATADYAPYLVVYVNSSDDTLCGVQHWEYLQHATPGN